MPKSTPTQQIGQRRCRGRLRVAPVMRPVAPALALLSLLLGLLGSVACTVPETPIHGDLPPSPEDPMIAAGRPLVVTHVLSGVLAAEQADQMVVPNVNQWPLPIRDLVENGALVEAGDLVVEFDNANVTNELERQRVAVLEALSQLEGTSAGAENTIAESELEVARRRAARDKAAIAARIPEGIRSAREYDRLRIDHEKAQLELAAAEQKLEADRTAAEADIAIARVNLQRVTERLTRTERWLNLLSLAAPRAGYVDIAENRREDRTYQLGDAAWPGDVVASLPVLESLLVRARLFDVDDGTIQSGQRAEVVLDAAPERIFSGWLRSVQPVAQQNNSRSLRRSFEVLVDLDELDLGLMRTGMSAKVIIRREESAPGAVQVPRSAVELLLPLEDRRALLTLGGGDQVKVELLFCAPLACLVRGTDTPILPGTPLGVAVPPPS
jgi:multidrug resistance efflux pump